MVGQGDLAGARHLQYPEFGEHPYDAAHLTIAAVHFNKDRILRNLGHRSLKDLYDIEDLHTVGWRGAHADQEQFPYERLPVRKLLHLQHVRELEELALELEYGIVRPDEDNRHDGDFRIVGHSDRDTVDVETTPREEPGDVAHNTGPVPNQYRQNVLHEIPGPSMPTGGSRASSFIDLGDLDASSDGPPMRNELDYHQDGSFTASGSLPVDEADAEGTPITRAFRALIQELQTVRTEYRRLLTTDGRIVGPERFELGAFLDLALNRLIVLRMLVEGREEFTAINMKYNYRFVVRRTEGRWTGHGLLGIYRGSRFENLHLWLSRVIHERLAEIVRFYGQAAADGVLDTRERIVLNRALDRLLFGIIVMRINLETGGIS